MPRPLRALAGSLCALALMVAGCGGDTVVLDATLPADLLPLPDLFQAAPNCTDGTKNGSETDIDCGGSCPACGVGLRCSAAKDCQSGVCSTRCQSPSCTDGVKNGLETDVDCGGGACPRCPDGKHCAQGSDCLNLKCASMSCGM